MDPDMDLLGTEEPARLVLVLNYIPGPTYRHILTKNQQPLSPQKLLSPPPALAASWPGFSPLLHLPLVLLSDYNPHHTTRIRALSFSLSLSFHPSLSFLIISTAASGLLCLAICFLPYIGGCDSLLPFLPLLRHMPCACAPSLLLAPGLSSSVARVLSV